VRQRRLGKECDGLIELGECIHLVDALDTADRQWSNRHGADRLLMTLVTDVDDAVALLGPDLDLVVDLGDQRAHGVDDVAAAGTGGSDDFRSGSVRGQHDRSTWRNVSDVVDEDHTLLDESIDDDLVVDDLVVAVHRWLEGAHHPRQRLDGHLHTCAEPTWLGQQDPIDIHGRRLPGHAADSLEAHVRTDGSQRRARVRR
jgi:hypothetical protein